MHIHYCKCINKINKEVKQCVCLSISIYYIDIFYTKIDQITLVLYLILVHCFTHVLQNSLLH